MVYYYLVAQFSSSDTSVSEVETAQTELSSDSREPKGTRGSIECITPDLVSVLDRCKVSDVAAIRVLIAAASAFQLDPKKYIINRWSLRKCRTQNRERITEFLKENPNVILIVVL